MQLQVASSSDCLPQGMRQVQVKILEKWGSQNSRNAQKTDPVEGLEMKQLAEKILKVIASVKSVSKDGFNAFHKYKYVTDAAIVSEIRREMIANRLILIPHQESCRQDGELTTLVVKYKLMDVDSGEVMESSVIGYGKDSGDKGIYKAATGAEKYYLLKTFLLPTDDDPENEKEAPRPRATKEDIRKFDSSLPPKKEAEFLGNQEVVSLITLMKEKNLPNTLLQARLKDMGIAGLNVIPKAQYNSIYEWIIKQAR